MLFDLSQLVSFPWLFARTPLPLSRPFLVAWLVVAGAAVVAGVAVRLVARRRRLPPPWRHWWRSVGSTSVGLGLAAFTLLFFRYERVPFFSARFWAVLWALAAVAAAGRLLWQLQRRLPAEMARYASAQTRRQYLP
jgi:hypothetical protein